MKLLNHKKTVDDYKYSDSIGIPQQVHHIKRVQKKLKKETSTNKINNAFNYLSSREKNTIFSDFTEVEFLGI